jgi:hypothetical protein
MTMCRWDYKTHWNRFKTTADARMAICGGFPDNVQWKKF